MTGQGLRGHKVRSALRGFKLLALDTLNVQCEPYRNGRGFECVSVGYTKCVGQNVRWGRNVRRLHLNEYGAPPTRHLRARTPATRARTLNRGHNVHQVRKLAVRYRHGRAQTVASVLHKQLSH